MTDELPRDRKNASSASSFEHKKHVRPKQESGEREEWVWILDYLPYGKEDDLRPVYQKKPLIQSLGDNKFVLLELIPVEGKVPPVHIKTHIGPGEKEYVDRVKARIMYDELSRGAKLELPLVLADAVKAQEARFIKFYNDAQPVSMRQNSLELLPGIGKKLMLDILAETKKKPFDNFEDLKKRVPPLRDPEKHIIDRIIEEMKGGQKYYVFAAPPKMKRE
ncbi:DUF655 domain-containing protein [Methanolapillus millepedarum]|uniref:DUF655 domain-containing protein n=1 Tax=Methanolapillus millepedarum TaxID=3028296 RepID=A0AA96V2B1_9EURY|nr:hypothetical protein MsAc7_06660 [Methanosarcinaceae archaeon Ac7]